jgi:3-hydroxyisobutyrate dehydrogenase-like beta-hydroxyacid dehydrogenase
MMSTVRGMDPAIGLLHPGEMGAAVGARMMEAGRRVRWVSAGRSGSTAERAAAAGLDDAGTLEELVGSCDLVISVCPPHAALDVAREVAAAGFAGCYVDANAVSPATALQVEAIVKASGARFVDGGIVGPPPTGIGTTRLYLSGRDAAEVRDRVATREIEVRVVSDQPGAASALKLAYAAWTKGSAALLLTIRAAALASGVETALLEEWQTSQPGLVDRSIGAARAGSAKGWRWVGEMEEIAAMFAALGLPDGFHRAAAAVYADLPWRPEILG